MQHPDEGTIHAWLDGELPEDQANEMAAHVQQCSECSAKVAEARGLIAASTRILTALDNVPAGMIPEETRTSASVRRRRWFDRTDIRAAAALLIVAGASFLVVRREPSARLESSSTAGKAEPLAAPVTDNVATESVSPAPPIAKKAPSTAPAARGGTGINRPMAKAPPTAEKPPVVGQRRVDAAGVAPRVAGPLSKTSSSQVGALGDVVHITSKRGTHDDGATFSGKGIMGGIAQSTAVVTGVAATASVVNVPLRVISADSSQTIRRTVYEVSPGVQVTLADSPGDPGKERSDEKKALDSVGRARAAVAQSSARTSATSVESMMPVPTSALIVNTISWTELGRHYELSGPLTTDQLQTIRRRLMEQRR